MTAPVSFLSKTSPDSSCWWLTPRIHIFSQALGNAEPLTECALGDRQIALHTLLTMALETMAAGDDEGALVELGAALAMLKTEAERLELAGTNARILAR